MISIRKELCYKKVIFAAPCTFQAPPTTAFPQVMTLVDVLWHHHNTNNNTTNKTMKDGNIALDVDRLC